MDSNAGFEIISSAVCGNFAAQLYKFIASFCKNKKFDFKRLFQTGGMPSSHTSFMSAMTTSVALISGYNSVDSAIALTITLVVMYDAAGLRQSVGKQAAVLNQILEEVFSEHPRLSTQRFRELLGHTPIEVVVGALLGIAVAIVMH